MPYDRETWDLTSVLQAIEPGNNYFNLSEKGTITIDSIGQSIFLLLKAVNTNISLFKGRKYSGQPATHL